MSQVRGQPHQGLPDRAVVRRHARIVDVEDTIEQFDAAREVVEKYPELAQGRPGLEGNVKAFGVHAAALVLSNEPITNVTAVIEREVPKGSGNWITCVALDKKDAERQGMVKMDFLGLNTMSMIDRALKWLGKDTNWLYSLPLDDPNACTPASRKSTSPASSSSRAAPALRLRTDQAGEVLRDHGLRRALPAGSAPQRRRASTARSEAGRKRVEWRAPGARDLLGTTHYQIVYQEQIMQIARVIGELRRRWRRRDPHDHREEGGRAGVREAGASGSWRAR
jgi:DNA polymerase-3 subunit alpha